MATEPLSIVLAEDDDGHATLIQRNLERAGLVNGFVRVKDGQEMPRSYPRRRAVRRAAAAR